MSENIVEFVKGLRKMADHLEANADKITELDEYGHGDVWGFSLTLNVFAENTDTFLRAVKAMGEGEKDEDNNYLMFRKRYSDTVAIELNLNRGASCERVPTGETRTREIYVPSNAVIGDDGKLRVTEEVTEWKCDDRLTGSWLADDNA